MARRGVLQLKKLVVSYCEFSGSSRGARDFVEHVLPRFQAENPQLTVAAAVRPGRHPFLEGTYLNASARSVGVKNADPGEILFQATMLRSAAGRKTTVRVKQRHVTRTPSIQGVWQPSTFPLQPEAQQL